MPKVHSREKTDLVAYIDGASRGNPGPAAYGVVVETVEGERFAELKKTLGRATNNVAEYHALLAALDYALSHHHPRLKVISDSELLTRQIAGTYKVKSLDLKPLYEQARQRIARLEAFSIAHVRREQNREADRLANQALDGVETQAAFNAAVPEPLRTSATYRQGVLKPHRELPLAEGQEVELEIRRKK
jgi:probable phosphoglycerate mutase